VYSFGIERWTMLNIRLPQALRPVDALKRSKFMNSNTNSFLLGIVLWVVVHRLTLGFHPVCEDGLHCSLLLAVHPLPKYPQLLDKKSAREHDPIKMQV